MAPKFGTSGLRGLVTELTADLVADYTRAFLACIEPVSGRVPGLYLGRDLRESSPLLARIVAEAARGEGVRVVDCGALPTPALALSAMAAGAPAIMVTGSHIPADRNGLKFYLPGGEITKAHEAAILAGLGRAPQGKTASIETDLQAPARYMSRYVQAFPGALSGARIGLWAHSSVARDLLSQTLAALGAQVTELGRSDHFIPVDTEAVDAATREQLRLWAAAAKDEGAAFDALVSTDGDADRPLVTDQTGAVIPGDILGQVTAQALSASVVVTPVSSNSGADDLFETRRTKIGSPFVIAAMEKETGAVVGYEANGGFLLGFDSATLPRLMTRDAFLPIIATLAAARLPQGFDLKARVAREPARFTATDRIEHIPTARSAAFLAGLLADELARCALLETLSLPTAHMIDTTDGLRMTVPGGRVLHLRPSGNAPEFRIYAEAASPAGAEALLRAAQSRVAEHLGAR
ncbi:phosphomannomutase [Stagnihabitans tardus]|uniref:Phosphomannomutase n=1 Tax=Stagnihabitans tardus TaxID=2699202 RepID=A0AAE5BU07_9RHOB|nr:phosphomannomutase [Stagnihabitans tardus]NBZ89660.1 phosphomannomutase [Stagnihabitans tardus]